MQGVEISKWPPPGRGSRTIKKIQMRRTGKILRRFLDGIGRRRSSNTKLPQVVAHTETAVQCALSFGWQAQTWRFGLVEHSARVSILSSWIAEQLGTPAEDIPILKHAAQLHEVGMIAVPHDLLREPRPLTSGELEMVRDQARIGGLIVRAAYDPIKASIVEQQYADFYQISWRDDLDPTAVELAGILRVADVFDTLLNPRPYQSEVPADRWQEVLGGGGGSFHPQASEVLLRLTDGA